MPSWVVMLLVPGLLLLPLGCSNDEQVEEEPMVEAPTDPMPESAVIVADPGPGMPQDRSPLGQELQERTLAEQKSELLAQEFVRLARESLDNGELEKAEELAMRALQEKESYAPALEVFRQARIAQGDAVATNADLVRSLVDRRRAQREKRVAVVRDHYVRALQSQRANDLQEAKAQLVQANLLIRFDPFQTDFSDREYGDLAAQVPAALRSVESQLAQLAKAREMESFEEAYLQIREEENRRRQREAEEVRLLMVNAVKRFAAQDFDDAERLARKALAVNPGLRKAQELIDEAQAARRVAWRSTYYAERREAWQSWMEDVRETQIPFTQILSWMGAEDWRQLSADRRLGDAVDVALDDSEAVRAIRAKLENETVDFDFSGGETTFSQAMRQIQAMQGINIVIDKEVELEKGEEPVMLTLVGAKLGTAIDLMLEGLELARTYKFDSLYITTAEKALGTPIPRPYEVRDLTISLPNFKAPDLNLRPGQVGESAKNSIWGENLDPTQDSTIDQIVDLIRENVAQGTWENEGFGLSPTGAGRLVVTTTPEIHGEVERFLDDLRRFTKLVVHVEARFISITKADLLEVGFDFRGLGGANPGTVALLDDVSNGAPSNASLGLDNGQPGGTAASSLSPSSGAFFSEPNSEFRARTENIFDRAIGSILTGRGGATVAFSVLDDTQITGLLRAVEQSANATLVNAPNLTIYNNQRANLTLVNQISYVKDYDVEVAQTAFIADPLVDVVQDGLTLDVRPTVSHDRKYVTLEVRPTVASLIRPIRTFETTLSGLTTPVVIELPEIEVKEASTTVRVPDGGYLFIGGFKQIATVDRRSEVPILANIPLINFLFTRKGRSDEIRDLMIVLNVEIVDLSEREAELGG